MHEYTHVKLEVQQAHEIISTSMILQDEVQNSLYLNRSVSKVDLLLSPFVTTHASIRIFLFPHFPSKILEQPSSGSPIGSKKYQRMRSAIEVRNGSAYVYVKPRGVEHQLSDSCNHIRNVEESN